MSDLPTWVWDMLIELEDQRDTHPQLLFQAGGMVKPERYDWCSCALLDKVPPDVTAQVYAIRSYLQAKARDTPEAKRELASQLLRSASTDEGYSEGQDERRG